MRWSAILAPLRHSHPANLSFATLERRNRASVPTLPSRISRQKGPSPTSQEQPRSSSQSLAIANSVKTPSFHVTEVENDSSCQAKSEPIRPSQSSSSCHTSSTRDFSTSLTIKTIAISADKDSVIKFGSGPGASSSTAKPSNYTSAAAEKAGVSTVEAGRREAFLQAKAKQVQVTSSSKLSCPNLAVAVGHGYEAVASYPYHANLCSAAKYSTSAVNQRINEASLSKAKAAGKVGHPPDKFALASTTRTSPSQAEGKVPPRALSYGSLFKDATRTSTTQMGERLLGVAHGALNKRIGNGSAISEDVIVGAVAVSEDVGLPKDSTASSNNDLFENKLANGSSEHQEGSAALEDKNKAGSKKSFAVSFPVTVVSEWWFSCFLQGNRPFYASLSHPLNKVYVWLAAYQRAHFDATGQYANGPSSAILMKQLLDLLNAVFEGRFRWGDENLVYLSAPVGHNKEPLSNATTFHSFQDRVVHEILHLVLEPIFEARFSARSHGFRPGRDVHTALRAAQRSFEGCTWFINGNLSLLLEEKYATHLVDSVFRFVRDTKVAFLLKSGFLRGMPEKEGSTYTCMFPDSSKLRSLLCNAFLDHLDWFMDEQISSLLKKEQPSTRNSPILLFKPERTRIERRRKLEYVRYGTEILVACNGTREEADAVEESVVSFFKQKFGVDFGNIMTINHISDGVKFLDHVISQKIVRPTVSRRRASSGRVTEKRAQRIRLCINASKECCRMHLGKIKAPTSLQHIEEMLSVLDNWYHYAENKEDVMQYCKLTLCYMYAKGATEKEEEGSKSSAELFKEAMHMVVYGQAKSGDSAKANLMPDFFWIPEYENALRDHAWLQGKSSMTEVAASLKTARKVSPQQHMSQVLWQYLRGSYGSYGGDNSWEPEAQMQTLSPSQEFMVDTKLEDFAESVG